MAEQLAGLRFTSGPVETLYLNKNRVKDDFLGQIGAIESFTRTATKEGKVDVSIPLVALGGAAGAGAGVTWALTDPTAQALVLREALQSRGQLHDMSAVSPGAYVQGAGRGLLSRPGMREGEHRAGLPPGLYEELEMERAEQEQILRMIDEPDAMMWLLSVQGVAFLVAAILDNRWLTPALPSWLGGTQLWNVFARARGQARGEASLLAAIHITATWQ